MKFYLTYLFSILILIMVIAIQPLSAIVQVASKKAVEIALINGFKELPTNEDMVIARDAYKKKSSKNCKVGNIQLMTTPWGNTPEEANKVFIISKCTYKIGPHPIIKYVAALKYDYMTNSYKFEGIFLPGVKREQNATGSLLQEMDLKYLLSGWIGLAREDKVEDSNNDEVQYVEVGGVIVDRQGNPISDVAIQLLFPHLTFEEWQSENYSTEGVIFNSFSDHNGKFFFEMPLARNLNYTMVIIKMGYKPIVKKDLKITTQKSPVILKINLEKK